MSFRTSLQDEVRTEFSFGKVWCLFSSERRWASCPPVDTECRKRTPRLVGSVPRAATFSLFSSRLRPSGRQLAVATEMQRMASASPCGGVPWLILSGFGTWLRGHSVPRLFKGGRRLDGRWCRSSGGVSCQTPRRPPKAGSARRFLTACASQRIASGWKSIRKKTRCCC